MADVAAFLSLMRRRGVVISAEEGRLRYQAQRSVPGLEEIAQIRALRSEIVAFLNPSLTHPPADRVPLTFSQRWSWNVLQLEQRPGTRSVALALRITGPLHFERLRQAFAALVRRHEALRTRIVVVEGVPWQEIDDPFDFDLQMLDAAEADAQSIAAQLVEEPVDLAKGPLFSARLMRFSAEHHMLAVAMDHIISDGVSMGILLRDLWNFYTQTAPLPATVVQFADYAQWQCLENASWIQKHGAYWRTHLAGAHRLRPFTQRAQPQPEVKVSYFPVTLDPAMSQALRDLSRRERTTLAMSVLTAYMAWLSIWCDEPDVVVALISMGRPHQALRTSLGYYGAALFLRIQIEENGSFTDLLQRVTQEYSRASLHADDGRISAQTPPEELVFNPRFNWMPRGPRLSVPGLELTPIDLRPRDDVDERGGGVELVLSDEQDAIRGALWYRADLFEPDTVRQFEPGFQNVVHRMINGGPVRSQAPLHPESHASGRPHAGGW